MYERMLDKLKRPTRQDMEKTMGAKSAKLWKSLETFLEKRYPCGKGGGWVHYRVTSARELGDAEELILLRNKPGRLKRD